MVYIGIDIAKRFYVLSAVGEDGGTLIESLRFANTAGRLQKAARSTEEGRYRSRGQPV
jgi:transposase